MDISELAFTKDLRGNECTQSTKLAAGMSHVRRGRLKPKTVAAATSYGGRKFTISGSRRAPRRAVTQRRAARAACFTHRSLLLFRTEDLGEGRPLLELRQELRELWVLLGVHKTHHLHEV